MIGLHVETELLAYLDGELDQQQRAQVEAHLAECPQCMAELERLRVLRQELDITFDAALSPVRLPPAADRRIRDRVLARTEPNLWWNLWRRRGAITQALLALLTLVFALNVTQALRPVPTAGPQETFVLGQDRLAPGSRAALRVLVRSPGKAVGEVEPVEGAEVVVRIGRTPGLASIVYTGYTGADGTAEVAFTVPHDLEGEASLVVETSSAGREDRIERPITIARDYKLFLSSDKPVYRPGQTFHVRALALESADFEPAAGQEIAFAIFDPAGRRLERSTVAASDFGIAGLDFALPPDAVHGQYTLRAALGDTVSERAVEVGAYDLPAFRVTLETDRPFYGPDERVTGFVQAEYFFGKPVAGGRVTLRGYVGEAERVQAIQVLGETDERGRFEFAFDLPHSLSRFAADAPVQFDLEAEVLDAAGQREGIRHLFPVAVQTILIDAVPEGGLLKPGVENAIFILTSYPDGRPAETELTVTLEGEEHTLSTGPFGLAELRHTPADAPAQIDVRAQDARGAQSSATFIFEFEPGPAALLLRAERAVYEVGDTLRAEVLVGGMDGVEKVEAQTVYLDVIRAGQTVAALSAPIEAGRAVFALDVDGTMVGTLELYAYRVLPDGSIVRDTRLVAVDAPRQVAVAVTADREEYRPGDTAHLQLQTALQSGEQPVQSALGIGVVDESVYAVETQPPGFARAYFLLERELLKRQAQGFDAPALFEADAEVQAARDRAAWAAWGGVPASDFTLSAQSITGEQEPQEDVAARVAISVRLGLALVLLPLLLGAVVVRGLAPAGLLGRALRRVGVGAAVLFAASPLVAVVVGGGMWLLWAVIGFGAPLVVLMAVVALLVGLAVHGWLRRDVRVQLATGLLAAYLVLGGLLVYLAARGGDPAGLLLALIALTFLLVVAALATLGQGLVLEGWNLAGWGSTLLALLLIPLVVYLPFVPGLDSGLTRTLGNPALYTGPVGWLGGCATKATPEVVEVEVEVTREVEVETEDEVIVEAETIVVTATPAPEPAEEAPAPAAEPTATPLPPIGEPFPLRQVFPETLYWDAEALTGEDGTLFLDLPLADSITTWRLTALASTQEGELGVATYDIVAFQDFFVDLDVPSMVGPGEEVTATVTLYNYLPQAQTVYVEPTPADWYTFLPPLSIPPSFVVTLSPNDVASVSFAIRAGQVGHFSLEVTAQGERMSDAVAKEVSVEKR